MCQHFLDKPVIVIGIYLSWEDIGAIGGDVMVVREERIQRNISLCDD